MKLIDVLKTYVNRPVRLDQAAGPCVVFLLNVGDDYVEFYRGDDTHKRVAHISTIESAELLPEKEKWQNR